MSLAQKPKSAVKEIMWIRIYERDGNEGKARTDLDVSLSIQKHVIRLDITMDDVALVEVVKTEQDLADPIAHERLLERAIIPQKRSDGAAGNVLQEDVEMIIVDARS